MLYRDIEKNSSVKEKGTESRNGGGKRTKTKMRRRKREVFGH
jgi:hypothetical protein